MVIHVFGTAQCQNRHEVVQKEHLMPHIRTYSMSYAADASELCQVQVSQRCQPLVCLKLSTL